MMVDCKLVNGSKAHNGMDGIANGANTVVAAIAGRGQ